MPLTVGAPIVDSITRDSADSSTHVLHDSSDWFNLEEESRWCIHIPAYTPAHWDIPLKTTDRRQNFKLAIQ